MQAILLQSEDALYVCEPTPRYRAPRGLPQAWLSLAQAHLAIARDETAALRAWSVLCMEAEMAVEMALKAVLVALDLDFPRTRDLEILSGLLKKAGYPVDPAVSQAARPGVFRPEARYPDSPEMTQEGDYRQALTKAANVVRWAESLVLSV